MKRREREKISEEGVIAWHLNWRFQIMASSIIMNIVEFEDVLKFR